MSSIFEKVAKSVFERLVKEGLGRVFRRKSKESQPAKKLLPVEESASESDRNHPWRLCPAGQHWVRTHPLTVPASSKSPEQETIRHGHCRANRGKAEVYTADELREIAARYFNGLHNDSRAMPISDALDFPNGNKYDLLIAGWTKFWNEALNPEEPLTADFVKALIATESSFESPEDQNSNDGLARGLIQVTENTRKILQNPKGELKNHHIEMTHKESREPSVNIAAGVRWLHHKKYLAEHRLNRRITWEEVGAEYKGILNDLGKHPKVDRIMADLRRYHKRLKDQRE